MKKNIAILMVITILIKIIGFAREIILSYFFGASSVSDVYIIAQTIPNTLLALIGAGLATTFIPIFNKVNKEKGDNEANIFTSNVINLVLIISTVIVLGVLLFTSNIVSIFAPGFSGETLKLAIIFTRISIFGVYFSGVVSILNAFLQLKNKFIIPSLISLPMNIILIISYVLASKYDSKILAYGILLSIVIQLVFILPSVMKSGYKYVGKIRFKNSYIVEMVHLAIPIIIGSSVNQINVLVDKSISSTIIIGGISSLNYANRLHGFVYAIFIAPIIVVLYPRISKQVVDFDIKALKKDINLSLVIISLLVIPASIGIMILSTPIVRILFERGEFTDTAVMLTANALFYYSIGIIASAFIDVFTRIFYAYKDTKTPTIIAITAVLTNIILNIILSKYMGLSGLALATSIAGFLSAILLLFNLKSKISNLGLKSTMHKMFKIIIVAITMGILTHLTYTFLAGITSEVIALVLSIIVGIGYYITIILNVKIEEVNYLIYLVKTRIYRFRKHN